MFYEKVMMNQLVINNVIENAAKHVTIYFNSATRTEYYFDDGPVYSCSNAHFIKLTLKTVQWWVQGFQDPNPKPNLLLANYSSKST